MSRAGKREDRATEDRYYTPIETARACVATLGLDDVTRVVEPSVGRGAFVRAIRERRYHVGILGVDTDPEAPGLALCDRGIVGDWMTADVGEAPDLILGNPPFLHAENHIRRALSVVAYGGTVAFLLRLAFLESAKRVPFWREFKPREVYVFSERPSFTADGATDSAAYGFYVWRTGVDDRCCPNAPTLGWIEGGRK